MTSTTTVSGHIESLENREKNSSEWWEVTVEDRTFRDVGQAPEELEEGLEIELEVNDSDDFGDIEDYNLVYEKQDVEDDEESGDAPVLANQTLGIAAWANKDKNGDFYLTVQVPLLQRFNLFVPDEYKEEFNEFCREVSQ